jgi:hypothetical protein
MAARDINSIMAGWVDRGPWQYWDTVRSAPSTQLQAQYNAFATPIGQGDPYYGNTAKTKLITNMLRGNQFPPPRCLVIMQVGFYFSSQMAKSDIDLIMDNAEIEVRIDDKIYMEGQIWEYPAGVGLAGVTTQTSQSVYTNGLPSLEATRRYGEYSKYIAPLQQFSMVINFFGTPPTLGSNTVNGGGVGGTIAAPTAPTVAMYLVPFFDGLTDRSVQ